MRIIVVRHGQAAPKKGWDGPDAARPLSSRGRRQAARLDRVIGPDRPDRVLSSPALRCVQTVLPFAVSFGIDVELTGSLATDAGGQAYALCRKLAGSEPPGATVVLCTHREALVDFLPRLAGPPPAGPPAKAVVRLPRRPPGAKGSAWILRFGDDGRLEAVAYRPPAA